MHPARSAFIVRTGLLGLLGLLGLTAILRPSHASADVPFVSGPYVDRLTDGTATLHVRTATPVAVHVEFEHATGHDTRDSPESTVHRIVLGGLPPDARVRYRVRAPGYTETAGSFHTAPLVNAGPIDLVALGDCRDGVGPHSRVIASIEGDPDFLLHLGDYVPTGSTVDEWNEFFRVASPLLKRTTIVPVLGNHEIIAPFGRDLYREQFALPSRGDDAYFVFDYSGVRVLVLDSNAPLDPGTPQHAFAKRELERAETDGSLRALFVAIHHGPMSSGRHGGLEVLHTGGLVEAMRRARVDLVFSGHDHIYERGESEGLKYVVTGGCGSPLYRANAQEPYQLSFALAHHFVRLRLAGTVISYEATRIGGSRIERCTFRRGESMHCPVRRTLPREAGVNRTFDTVSRYSLYGGVVLALGASVVIVGRFARRRMA